MNFRLLIVEDQQDVARTLARALEMRRFVVSTVHSCADALKFAGQADCAVLDIDLPDGSGLELAVALKAKGAISTMVFFSGCSDEDVRNQARSLGRFVPKSAGMHDLAESILDSIRDARPAPNQSASFEAQGDLDATKLKCS